MGETLSIKIGSREISNNSPVFIVAELSANHGKDFNRAVRLIEAAKDAGADAVKLQTYTPDTITIDCDNEYFRIRGTIWDGKTLYQLYKEAYTPWEWQPELKALAEGLGLVCFSTPFDAKAVDFLEEMGVPAYKIASFEITDIPLIEYVASKGKPVMISTGIATLPDIEEAVEACKRMGNEQVILLKCTSAYPAPLDDVNLLTIPEIGKRFGKVVGLSDHTLGISVPVAAVALGARVIEKHLILRREDGGPDAAFSLEPEEFREMVTRVREVEKALGKASYSLSKSAERSRIFSRSLFAVRDILEGEELTPQNVRSIRPGYGLHPRYLGDLLGKRARCFIKKGTPISWELIED